MLVLKSGVVGVVGDNRAGPCTLGTGSFGGHALFSAEGFHRKIRRGVKSQNIYKGKFTPIMLAILRHQLPSVHPSTDPLSPSSCEVVAAWKPITGQLSGRTAGRQVRG